MKSLYALIIAFTMCLSVGCAVNHDDCCGEGCSEQCQCLENGTCCCEEGKCKVECDCENCDCKKD